jgi:thioredoxin reductase (NADPH)
MNTSDIKSIYNVCIVGSGPAAFSAAVYLARSELKPVLFTGYEIGGQLMLTNDVENYVGIPLISGPDLINQMTEHATKFGTEIIYKKIVDIKKDRDKNGMQIFILEDNLKNIYYSYSVIIATGASAKWLGIESEDKFKGYGVSGCATCDGLFFKNKIVCVVGGGNAAMEEVLFLSNIVKKIYLIHRGDSFPKAEKILVNRVLNKSNDPSKKIEILYNKCIHEILGNESEDGLKNVTGIILKDTKNLDKENIKIELDGIFIAIGHTPNTGCFANLVHLNSNNYIQTYGKTTKTSCPGIFAAGDVQDDRYRQAITAAGTGCMAALDVNEYLGEIGLI